MKKRPTEGQFVKIVAANSTFKGRTGEVSEVVHNDGVKCYVETWHLPLFFFDREIEF